MYVCLIVSGIIFLILDKYFINKHFIALSSAFLFSAAAVYKIPDDKEYIGVVLLPLFYLVFYIMFTKILNSEKEDIIKEETLCGFIGKSAVVTKDIGKTLSIDGIGQIKFNNNLWAAKNIEDKEIKAGKKVEIVSKENMIMNVKAKRL